MFRVSIEPPRPEDVGPESTDRLVHATAADDQLRCLAAVTTELVGEACRRHRTFPTSSVALGRTLTGGLLLGSSYKDLEKITVHFHCDGPIRNIIAQADPHGNVRGYVSNPEADAAAMNSLGKFDVRAIVGSGTLYVTREAGFDIGLQKEPYRGSVPIVSGEIAEDLAHYLAKSEQIPSAVSLGVLMKVASAEPDNYEQARAEFDLDLLRVSAAGGYIIQILPSAQETIVRHIERVIPKAPPVTDMVSNSLGPMEILTQVLGDLDLNLLGTKEPKFLCPCSSDRALQIISALGREEIEDMLERDNGAELTCHFCNETYGISAEALTTLLEAE
jgi:molecular chaperone Hsp33